MIRAYLINNGRSDEIQAQLDNALGSGEFVASAQIPPNDVYNGRLVIFVKVEQ